MISGAHVIVQSKDSDADRAFLRDVLGLPHVDAGGGWLIFALPSSEVAVHPSKKNSVHELYLLCDDVNAFVRAMGAKNIGCDPVSEQQWGLLTSVTLPGGGKLGVYEPRHARPSAVPSAAKPPRAKAPAKKAAKRVTPKPAPKPKSKPRAKRRRRPR